MNDPAAAKRPSPPPGTGPADRPAAWVTWIFVLLAVVVMVGLATGVVWVVWTWMNGMHG